jgi:hypothetical protein
MMIWRECASAVKMDAREFWAAGLIGRGYKSANAHQVECGYHYSGSGGAFGGARRWPVLSLTVSFQEHEEGDRDELARELRRAVNRFFTKRERGR